MGGSEYSLATGGSDIEGLDSSMADNFVRTVRYGCNVAVTLTTVAYFGGWPFMLGAALTMIVYYRAGSVYGQASRDMRRLDSVTRSPLYSLFGETVSGVAVLRAFGASTVALSHMMRLSDTNILCFFWTWTINRWLSARFNILSSALVGLTAAAMLMAPVSAATAGFALAFVSTVMHNLLFVVRRFVQLEQSMVALERIKEYSEIQPEAAEYVEPGPPEGWPAKGEIEVKDLVIKYAPDLPDVLHGLTFNVKPGEKVGIVGSTGCGKSTLALSFFRFVEATKGSIVIDDVDISTLGLTDLRSRIMIIPQDPTILSGTLRNTLDVFDEYSDAEIYEALRRVHLLSEDATQPPAPSAASSSEATVVGERNANVFADLNYPVTEGGDNFSTGEKQLLCMARAILRRNKILLMDEATASIDAETDTMISETIRTEFTDSTILTIAHRLHTIIDFDTVIVMDKGSIAEMGSPYELLRKKGRFYVSEFIFHLFTIIDAPIEILVATGFLFQLLGTSALWGLLATLISMPLTHVASKIVVTAQDNLMKARDQRSALMNELLQAVRMVKGTAWRKVSDERDRCRRLKAGDEGRDRGVGGGELVNVPFIRQGEMLSSVRASVISSQVLRARPCSSP
ncbi:hypothetical protein A1Q1_03871 [Trichosporon asahii var. asahii CBS 2479]|uniref:Uncharacterized protein n=1 Tax=Trichosporon asahii var. asahii (strain ATCC 90039 / CBS 2479 / JCM 2466 / KCTC 7840 / NBRC 103889/ NCYC 2677 / UAMH 7654) TaxID=1186058 RepID=J4U9K6_TRIAS|nr:hypothetical protein A1Q1_03871 [Trichosporon asahii var. asahii CBS 2479]EJT47325.1 hypothetical protein A1Q1_03871 [Trichosporon asahii var. asahii CBS 2479]